MKTYILRYTYAAIAALFIALFALPQQTRAETKYDLWIAGTQVTSTNCNDLSTISGVSGIVKYDPANKVLTLQNAVINSDDANAINSNTNGLTIKVVGENTLRTKGNTTLCFWQPVTIMGCGVLNAKCETATAIYVGGTHLTIDNCIVNAESGAWGIEGASGSNEILTIKNATVTAIGTAYGSILKFAKLNLSGCKITEPTGAKFDSSKHGVVQNGEIVKSKVVIQGPEITTYDLQIAGVKVTSAICKDLSVIEGVSGTVKYDPANKVLTLQKATISCNSSHAIYSKIDGLTIKVIGKSNLSTTPNATLSFKKPLTIMGGGELNAKSKTDCAIYADGTNLTIDNCTVNAESGRYGIAGYRGSSEKLTINNATVTAIGKGDGSICDFAELNLIGCKIIEPTGATFDPSKHGVVLNGEIVTSKVVIAKTYDLKIAGVEVTSANCNNLGSIDGVSGTVKYDPGSKTLTLDNARISTSENTPIESSIDGLTIKVVGTNNLIAGEYSTITINKPVTITGGGVLNAKANGNIASGILVFQTHLTIDNCTVNIESKIWGITGYDENNDQLTIKNATVTAIGKGDGSILDFAKLNLIGCSITEPTGATFDPSKHGVVLNGELVTSKVVIKKNSTAIEAPTADNKAKQGIYTIGGVKLNGEVKDLPKGIYIVNGKKVVKK